MGNKTLNRMILKMVRVSLQLGTLFMLIFLIFSHILNAQSTIIQFDGEDLNGRKVEFPTCLSEKKTLVGFAFSQKSQEALESWVEPVYYELMDTNSLASLVYDANVYLVIVFNASTSSFKGKLAREMKQNFPEDFYDNIIFSDAEAGAIKKHYKITNSDILTLFTFSVLGEITSRAEGFYSESKFDKLSANLEIDYE